MGGTSTILTSACGASAAMPSTTEAVSSGSRAVSRPPPRTTGVFSPVSPSRRIATSAIVQISVACCRTRSRATWSPSDAAASSTGASPRVSCTVSLPWWMAMATSATSGNPKRACTVSRSKVSGPRPSSARMAHHNAARPRPKPPPQSPVMLPRAR